tara:strand:- start:721 stop:2409 length:1689 start_codon:yes stop_codon:yes gene_type:complete
MTSIFDLKTNVSELSSANEGTSRMEYDQHPPTRDVVGNNFANGAIHFRFQTSGNKWWIPSRSYTRMRFRLTDGAGTPLTTASGVAPNMGLMSSLFQSGEFRINDKVVSRVADFMPQVDALETRLTKSKSWIDSVGSATNWWDKDQSLRLAEVSSDGTILKNTTAIVPADATTTRTGMGFDAVGGAATRNQWAYTAANGALVYNQGTDATGLAAANASLAFPIGSYFKFVGVAATPEVEMQVLSNDGVGGLVVEPLLNVNVAGSGANDFTRVVKNTNIAAPDSRRLSEFELTWTPPLSLFKIGHALPGGKYEMVLNPQTITSFQKRAIESILGVASKNATLPGGAVQDFKLEVVDFYLYCATVEGPRADDITYLLDLEQTRCQSEKIDNTSFAQKNFDVSPSTYALTVAYQDLRAGENTALSVSKFKSYNNPAIPNASEELKLNRFFINYSGQNLPAPDADPSFVAGTDYTTQRYAESQIYSGAYFDTGGAETIEDYHDRGAYYYFSWPRDGTDRSTRVNVHQGFQNTADITNMRCLLFDHSKQVARVRVQDGRVVDVQVEDA